MLCVVFVAGHKLVSIASIQHAKPCHQITKEVFPLDITARLKHKDEIIISSALQFFKLCRLSERLLNVDAIQKSKAAKRVDDDDDSDVE